MGDYHLMGAAHSYTRCWRLAPRSTHEQSDVQGARTAHVRVPDPASRQEGETQKRLSGKVTMVDRNLSG